MNNFIIFLKYLIYYLICFLWIVPIIWMVFTTFKYESEVLSFQIKWFPSKPTIDNLISIFDTQPIITWMKNSFFVVMGATTVTLITSTLAAYSLARIKFYGHQIIFFILISAIFIPWEINAIPLFFIVNELGLLNTMPGIFLPISAMPISLFLLRQFFIGIPDELEQASKIDGCGHFRILYHIIIPLSLPAFGALGVFIFIFSWNEFFWSMVSLQRSNMMTLPVGMKTLVGADDITYTTLMSASFIASLPALIIYLVLRKKIISGISMTGVKK